MSDGSLSQDEIDALLQGSGGMDFDEPAEPAQAPASPGLSVQDRKAFQRIIADTVETQASNFSMLVSKNVTMRKPTVDVVDAASLAEDLDEEVVQISMDLNDGIFGRHCYVMPLDGASHIAGAMMGQDDIELDDAALNAIQEAASQVSGPLLTALGDNVGATVMSESPQAVRAGKDEISLPGGDFVTVTYPVQIEDGASFDLIEVFAQDAVSEILDKAGLRGGRPAPEPAKAPTARRNNPGPDRPATAAPQGFGMPQMGAMGGQFAPQQNVQPVQFPGLQGSPASSEQGNISLLMDVYMEMTVELGRTKKLIKEILGMGEGTIIELDKLAGEPVDILVNHKLIAKGEVVVSDENFGVRVTEIVSTMERINNMT